MLRYLNGTTLFGLVYRHSTNNITTIEGFVYANYVGYVGTRNSIFGYVYYPSRVYCAYTLLTERVKEAL